MSILGKRDYYKPFVYPEAFTFYNQQQQMHWLATDVPMHDDVRDLEKLSEADYNLVLNIQRFFTQCYSSDTEVLTPHGWKLLAELEPEDKVAQVNKAGELSFVQPTHYHKSNYTGDMYFFRDGRSRVNLLVTPNHKMVYTYKGEWREERADKFLPYQGVKLHRSGIKKEGVLSLSSLDRIRIAYQADGCVSHDWTNDEGTSVYFAFRKKRKADRLEELCKDAGVPYRRWVGNRGYYNLRVYLPTGVPVDKNFNWVTLDTFSSNWAAEFLSELKYWDGHDGERKTYCNTNEVAASKALAVAAMSGLDYTFSKYTDDRSDKFSDVYTLSWGEAVASIPVDGQAVRRNSEIVGYSGNVYCVTVPSGMLLVKRGTGVAVCGNSDVDVGEAYMMKYGPILGGHPEVRMMLSAFANMEAVHAHAYSLWLDTVGLPESEYRAFADYEEMAAKHEYISKYNCETPKELVKGLAVYSAFTEGMQLFSAFVMLLHFAYNRRLLTGMGQVVAYSIRDESHHVEGMTWAFRTLVSEQPELWDSEAKAEIVGICHKMVELEDAFIDRAFELGDIEGLTAYEVKQYIRYIADRRLNQLGLSSEYGVPKNPLPWVEDALNSVEMGNFFEMHPTEYGQGTLEANFSDCVWGGNNE